MFSAIFIFAAFVVTAQCNSNCETTAGEKGLCLSINDCVGLKKIVVEGNQSENQTNYLLNNKCEGEDQSIVYICCGLDFQRKPTDNSDNKNELLPRGTACGQNFLGSKISNGVIADLRDSPWTARLLYSIITINFTKKEDIYCAGSLINNRYVLTAAHCVTIEGLYKVRLGEFDETKNPDCSATGAKICLEEYQDVDIGEIYMPNTYNNITKENDIALLRLKTEVKFSETVKPICLPLVDIKQVKKLVGKTVVITGWGTTENDEKSSVKLRADITVQYHADCENHYRNFKIGKGQFCAIGKNFTDTCRGDSGGPVSYAVIDSKNDQSFYVLVGITSFGSDKCGHSLKPGIYTRVSEYMDWITETMYN